MIRLVAPSSTDYHGYRPWQTWLALGAVSEGTGVDGLIELEQGVRVTGVVPIEVAAVERSGGAAVNLIYRSEAGGLDQRPATSASAGRFGAPGGGEMSFNGGAELGQDERRPFLS